MSVKIRKSESGVFRQSIRVNQHTIFADVAQVLGGNDSAPDPHDLYDASLAACKAITILMYAKRRKMPLEYLDLDIERDASEESAGQYRLHVSLRVYGALSADDLAKISDIADKCPVHKLMTHAKTSIETEISVGEK